MATGTGLPKIAPDAPVLAQAAGGVSGDALFNAASWTNIANSGEKLAKAGGDYLKVSEHKAQVGYLADQDVEIQRKQIDLRNQFANDPKGFDAAWSGYAEGKLSTSEPWAVGHVRAKLGGDGNSAYSAVLNETRVKSDADAQTSWGALHDMASNDVQASAMAGTLNTPEGQAKIDKYRGVVATGVTSKFIVPEVAEQRVATLESVATVYAARKGIKDVFENQGDGPSGPIGAVNEIDRITRDEKLKLSPDQRLTLGSRLRADVHAWDAERNQNLSTVDLESQSLLKAKQGGIPITQSRIDDVVERYKKFGGQAQAASFLADVQHTDDLSFLGRVPVKDAAAWVDQYKTSRGFNSPDGASQTAMDYFQRQGYSQAQAAGIVGNLVHESGLNPNAVHDQGTGLGIAGHRLERLDAMKAYAASVGKPVNDFQTQLEFINKELQGSESAAGAKVRAARTPEEAAAAFINFERPQGYDPANISASHGYANRVGQAQRLASSAPSSNLAAADAAMSLTPQEKDLYKRHFSNLYGAGGVDNPPTADNPQGSRSTLYQSSVEHNGKTYNIPTVWDGKILSIDDAVERVKKEGWDKFPAYANEKEAEARYQQMHSFMDKDTGAYFDRKANPPKSVPSVANDNTFIGKANTLVAGRVSDDAVAIVKQMKDGTLPTEQRINDLVTAASATNTPEVLQQVAQAASEYQFRRQFGRAPEPQESAAISELHQKAVTEGLSTTDARRLEIATQVRDSTAKALADDPLNHTISALAETSGLKPPAPLNIGNPVQFQAGLAARSQWAATGTATYQTAPMPALTTAEAGQVRAALDAADPAGKARIYSDIVQSTSGGTRAATLAQLAKGKGVDGMVQALAGGMLATDADVASSIIRGQGALKTNESFNPFKEGNKSDTLAKLDKYMPPSTFSLAARTDPEGTYAVMRGAVAARVADLTANNPSAKGDFPDAIFERAVADVTGGIVKHNDASLITPIRGMNQRGFDQKMAGLTDRDVQGVQTQNGTPITADYVRNNAQLESLSDGRYLVRLGRDAERPIYAFRDTGTAQPGRLKPFVLDLRPVAPVTATSDPLASMALP